MGKTTRGSPQVEKRLPRIKKRPTGYMTYGGKPSLRAKMYEFFNTQGDDTVTNYTTKQLQLLFKCSSNAAHRYRRDWLERRKEQGRERGQGKPLLQCTRCGCCEQPHNPVFAHSGWCLWCWADIARIDLGPLVQRWGWPVVIELFRVFVASGVN